MRITTTVTIRGFNHYQNLFGTYLCRQSTLVLKVQPYLFVFNFAAFWASFALFWGFSMLSYGPLGLFYGPLRLLWGALSGSKPIFGTYQWSQSTLVLEVLLDLFCFLFGQIWDLFCTFEAFWGYFCGRGEVQKLFWDLLTTFILEV